MKLAILGLVASLSATVLCGCGDSKDSGGSNGAPACGPTLNGSCKNHTGTFCTEYSGLPAETLTPIVSQCTEADSDGPQGVWSTEGCTHTRAVGGCKGEQAGICTAVWLYVGSVAEVKRQCSDQNGTWVDP